MKRIISLCVALVLAGCTMREQEVDPHPYALPTYVPCKTTIALDASGNVKRPTWPDDYYTLHGMPRPGFAGVPGAFLQIGVDGQMEILVEGISARDKWIDILETALNGCLK